MPKETTITATTVVVEIVTKWIKCIDKQVKYAKKKETSLECDVIVVDGKAKNN